LVNKGWVSNVDVSDDCIYNGAPANQTYNQTYMAEGVYKILEQVAMERRSYLAEHKAKGHKKTSWA
jgi:hypothetical protein